MFEAVADWLVELSADAPVTMIVDDVHWAAESTLQLLGHLQQRQSGGAVAFVLTSRDTAPDVNPRVSDLIATGSGRPATAVIRLEGLNSHEAMKLVGDGLDLDEVMRQTAGNPLFLQAVNRADGTVDMQSAVRRRLASLDERVQETLRVCSVLGLEFELRVAATATDRDELDLLDDLELAVAARLLDDVGHDRFRFAHALVRASFRDELSSSRQARMHRRISMAIHDIFGDDPRHLPELAFHTAKAAAVDSQLRPRRDRPTPARRRGVVRPVLLRGGGAAHRACTRPRRPERRGARCAAGPRTGHRRVACRPEHACCQHLRRGDRHRRTNRRCQPSGGGSDPLRGQRRGDPVLPESSHSTGFERRHEVLDEATDSEAPIEHERELRARFGRRDAAGTCDVGT